VSRVRIVGGGLTGILAAFEAHRLGARDIELHERFDALGGVALPQVRHGLELRDGCIYFGPVGDPIRALLESHGLRFAEFDNRFGSVSLGEGGELVRIEDFGGPALPCASTAIAAPAGPSLADRIAAYPPPVAEALARYAAWHLGWDSSQVHGEAAVPMAINRVFPTGANLAALAEAKRSDPTADELWAIPRGLWGRTNNLVASLPEGGFPALLEGCRRGLEAAGVRIHTDDLVSPRQALAAHAPGEVLVWAANPTPLFKAAGAPTPRLKAKSFATYVFAADWDGPRPFYVQNFTAQGACFRIYVYESGPRTLLLAECVAEAQDRPLREEIGRLLHGFGGPVTLGELLSSAVKPRWIYHTCEAIEALGELRRVLGERMGPAFVPGAWEAYAKGEKFAQVNADLARALGVAKDRAAAA
jgi:hypothetical protein